MNFVNWLLRLFLNRAECGDACKQRKQMLENECKQLRRELTAIDEFKKSAEQQSRNYEQEVQTFTFNWKISNLIKNGILI